MRLKIIVTANLDDFKESSLGNYEFARSKLFICGNLRELGDANLNKAVELDLVKYENSNIIEWSKTIDIKETIDNLKSSNNNVVDLNQKHYYKYFMAERNPENHSKIFLNQIETSWRELLLSPDNGELVGTIEINDNLFFKQQNQQQDIDYITGWLLDDESELQFHFFDRPMHVCMKKYADLEIAKIDIVPTNCFHDEVYHTLTQSSFNQENLVCKNSLFNAFNKPDVYTTIRVRTHVKPSELSFQFKLFKKDPENASADPIYFATSFFKINKAILENSVEELEIPLLDAIQNKIIGHLKVEVLLITSLNEKDNYNLNQNYNYDFEQKCLLIGHRGMGKTFDAPLLPNINEIENTIESFNEAFKNGAQMVEFDVVLTKDKVPVIYHDFSFCIKNLNDNLKNDFIDIPAIHLTYDEIKKNRIYSHKVLKEVVKSTNDLKDELFSSSLMFPTLDEMFSKLDTKLGFDVEIKYPIDLEDGTHEADRHLKWPNRNEYADIIIKELYKCVERHGNERFIILTTFDPNLCSILRIKQNKFPVLFLTNGVTRKWVPFKDLRCKNSAVSYNFAKSENFQGFVPHAEELVKDINFLQRLRLDNQNQLNKQNRKFLSISWGDDLNNLDNRKLLMENGIHGIIYDRINESPNASTASLPVFELEINTTISNSLQQQTLSSQSSPNSLI